MTPEEANLIFNLDAQRPWDRDTYLAREDEAYSPAFLAKFRAAQVVRYAETGIHLTEFTCDTCPLAPRCTLAFDAYNTNGDCLLEK